MQNITGNPFDYTPGKVYEIDIRLIEIDDNIVFRDFADIEKKYQFDELKESIRKNGLLENLIVSPILTGFKLISGYRRFMACRELGFEKVNCLVIEEEKIPEVLIEENEKREDLDFIEQAQCYLYIVESHKIEQQELAKRLNKSDTYISNMLSVAKLDVETKKMIRESKYFSKSIILEVLRLNEKGAIKSVLKYLANNPLPVKKLRIFIKEINDKKPNEKPKKAIERAKQELKDFEKLIKKKQQIDSWFSKYEKKVDKVDLRELNYMRKRAEEFLRFLRDKGYLVE